MYITETISKGGAGLDQAQERMEELRRIESEKLEARNGIADTLEDAASSVRITGRQGAQSVDDLSESTAGRLDSTAAYVRSHDVGDMLLNLQQVIGKNPAAFLLLAASIGFLAGSAVRRIKSRQ